MANAANPPPATLELDLKGLRCPLPVIKTEAALRRLPPKATLCVITDDPLAAIDIPHYCTKAGHHVALVKKDGTVCVFMVTSHDKNTVENSKNPYFSTNKES